LNSLIFSFYCSRSDHNHYSDNSDHSHNPDQAVDHHKAQEAQDKVDPAKQWFYCGQLSAGWALSELVDGEEIELTMILL
jgi:hypothetical protein